MKTILSPGNRMFFFLLIAFAGITAFFNTFAAIGQALLILLVSFFYRRQIVKRRKSIVKYLDELTTNLDAAGRGSVAQCPLPLLILRVETGEIIWANSNFLSIAALKEGFFERRLPSVLPGFDLKLLGRPGSAVEVNLRGKVYLVHNSLVRQTGSEGILAILYFVNITELISLRSEYRKSRPVVCVILIDNYDECVKNLSEAQKSSVLAGTDDKITAWAAPINGFLRKYDRDRYLLIFEEREMPKIIENKFSLLEDVREVVGPAGLPVSLSLGLGRDGKTVAESYSFAQLAIDMALSRGGDQAVVKNSVTFEFFGGRSKEIEKRTKVKSRVVASSLSRIIMDSSSVFVMGHMNSDIDSLGASAGVVAIARKCGKSAKIIINEEKTMAASLLTKLRETEAYQDTFIGEQTALLHADSKSLLVVVDCNRPEIVEFPAFLRSMQRVAVIDHHRRSADYIDTAILVMHEPYASSASELVCELIQYVCSPSDLLRIEAEALMAGIVLDTKGFTMHTGMRTFEAAAFLRGAGADPIEIKRLFQSDMKSSMERHEIIASAKIVHDTIAVAAVEFNADRAIAAQAADELLSIIGINASFVLFRSETGTDISGRSLDSINVQMILERLGGGGHQNIAGAQLKGATVPEALEKLRLAIDLYFEESEFN